MPLSLPRAPMGLQASGCSARGPLVTLEGREPGGRAGSSGGTVSDPGFAPHPPPDLKPHGTSEMVKTRTGAPVGRPPARETGEGEELVE